MKPIIQIFRLCIYLLPLFFLQKSNGQNVGISTNSNFIPDASAALDVSYNNKGMLIPRVALTATNAAAPITSPATSLLVYNTATTGTSPNNVVPGFYYWNGSAWVALSTSTNGWSLTGNTGTNASTNFIGTNDATDFVMKTNGAERAKINAMGDVSIGGTALNATNPEQLLVNAGTTSSYNVISGKGSINNYLQLNIQNNSNGAIASSDVVASNDLATETTNFVDLGINSSANTSSGVIGGVNTGYLYSMGNDFAIGNGTAGKNLLFFTGGVASNEKMRIDGNGNIGIGTQSPNTKLHVFGANPLTLSGVVLGTSTTADSVLTITSGLVRKLPIATFAATGNDWSTTGNTGTTAGTNFLGTTDAKDLVLKANNIERFRIVNGVSTATGTAGDITIGDATSGTLRATKELLIREDGDTFGPSALRLRNRTGENGAIFETIGASANLVDFIFRTGTSTTPIGSNLRFDTRSGNIKVTGNTTEWQFGQPDVTNGGPTLVVGAAGTGSNSAFLIGNVGIGIAAPTAALHLKAGTANANTAPLKLTTGTNLTTPESGAVEFDGNNYYGTANAVRYTLAKTLTATAALNFPSTGVNSASNLTVTINGAVDGDAVSLGVPSAAVPNDGSYFAYVSAANTVTIKFVNNDPLVTTDPPLATFRISVIKY